MPNRNTSYGIALLAIVKACQIYRMFLLEKKFMSVTDCSVIVNISDYSIVHREGTKMNHVDPLSKSPKEITNDRNTIQDLSSNAKKKPHQ